MPQRPVAAMAPAGAINSCATDFARWLLAQLGDGQLDGRAVMSPGTVARQHEPHIVLPEDRTFPASTRHAYITGLTVPFESLVEPQRFDRRPDASAQDPEVLRRLCGTYVMGPIEVVVALRGDHVLTVAICTRPQPRRRASSMPQPIRPGGC